MITRRKDYIKHEPTKEASKIYIICEGRGTEPAYYSFFEGLSSNLRLIVIPPEEGTDPLKLMALADNKLLGASKKYDLDYTQNDKVWFVIDTDTWEQEGKIAPLRKFCDDKNAEIKLNDSVRPYRAWHVCQSNPCFEVWLYYHHYQPSPYRDEVNEYLSVKDFLNQKISGGFNFQRDQVLIESAISNSKKNYGEDTSGQPLWFTTEGFYLGEEILKFVKREIAKLKGKM